MKPEVPLYNARILSPYIKLIRERYPHISLAQILLYAEIESYEVEDENHWFTQSQVDRFYEKIVQLTGNVQVARDAGRMAAAPGSVGIMRQYTLGLLGPLQAFTIINKVTRNFTRSTVFDSKSLSKNKVEITVTPNPGAQEKPYQCESRIGFFEAIVSGFNLGLPKIEHPECVFRGGATCRYTITWKRTFASLIFKARNVTFIVSILAVILGFAYSAELTAWYLLPLSLFLCTMVSLVYEIARRKEMLRSMAEMRDATERLTEQTNINYRNVQLTQEIGQALSSKNSVEDVIQSVVQVMEKQLDFDRGAILLADQARTQLEIRGAYGYSNRQLGELASTAFRLDNPNSQGPFVLSFHEQKPYLINNIEDIRDKLTPKSRRFIEQLGTKSFLCCPIVVEGASLGILGVDNLTSKRPLVSNDVSLLMGIAPVIGVSLQNAALIEEQQATFEKTLKILADSIDARDFMTAGHSEVVTEYAGAIADELELGEDFGQMIRVAALLHDYGKIGVPDSILKKDGRLTVEEREIINTHPAKTKEILSQVPFRGIQKQIPEITGAHHERWDGSGYPDGLSGEAIPLGARILAVADFFEAITSKRHYRDPMPLDVAMLLLRQESGKHFDPQVVEAFFRYLHSQRFCLFSSQKSSEDSVYTRKSPRIEYRTQVSARSDRRVISGSTVDICEEGAYVSSSERIDIDAEIVLTFTPPGLDELVQVRGRVAWINNKKMPVSATHPEGFGLQFFDVPHNVQSVIADFVKRRQVKVPSSGKVIYPKKFANNKRS